MKIRHVPLAIFAALLAAGCGKKETTTASSAPASAPAATSSTPAASSTTAAAPAPKSAAPAAAPAAAGARVIEITANDQMKFSVTNIEAKVGEEIKIVLKNIGTLPKEAMGHNWVLLKPGSDGTAFSTAAVAAKDKEYIPDALKEQVVAHTKLIGPRETAEVTFKVPAAGEYPFLCSFPAHYVVGMKGTLVAK